MPGENPILINPYAEPLLHYATNLAGEPAGHARDGGRALADPKHPDHQYIREWFGDDVDPAGFKMDETNRLLDSLRM